MRGADDRAAVPETADTGWPTVTAPPADGVPRRRAGSGIIAVAVLLAAAASFFAGLAYWAHTVSAQSAYTQAHGVPARGSVVLEKSSMGKSWLEVRLAAPVDDEVSCVLHVPHGVSVKPGSRVGVAVDPQDPSYCEIPGDSYGASQERWFLAWGVVGAFVFGIPLLVGTFYGRRSRRRRGISR
jgi:hypothetical protein